MKGFYIIGIATLLATGAWAHSPLETTTPVDGAEISAMPTELTLTFKRNMRLTRVNWTFGDQDPTIVDLDGQTSFATDFTLPFDGVGPGTYIVEWRGLSDDGHPQNGQFSFSVE